MTLRIALMDLDGWRADGFARAQRKVALCAQRGVIGLHPLLADLEIDGHDRPLELIGRALMEAQRDMLRTSAAVIAEITPFRGPSLAPSIAWALGFAAARGLPVHAFGAAPVDFAARTVQFQAQMGVDDWQIERFPGAVEDIILASGLSSVSYGAGEAGFAEALSTLLSMTVTR